MAEVASAYVSLIPSAKGFGGKIQAQVGGDLDKAGKAGGQRFGSGMSSGLAGVGSKVFAPLAAAAAAISVGSFLKDAVSEARESQKVGALTTQVIKSTGGAAKITAGQVGDLATAISNKTGIDDEAIQSASNLLLTFTNVRNEVGKGNDVFNQATQAATDMGAALGNDPKAAAIQLGKALNDPVKGVTALSKVGVSFTAQQKAQIKTMTASGNTLGAQKLILGELKKEFGGAAAASATAGEKLSTAFGNFKEQIGTALLPVIDKVATFLTARVIPAVSSFISGLQDGTGAGGQFRAFLTGIWTALQPIGAFLMGTVVPAIRGFFASFQSGGGPSAITAAFQTVVAFIRGQVIPGIMAIVGAVRGFVAVALPIIQAFVAGMMARITPMLPAVRAIFAQVGAVVVGALGLIKGVIQAVTAVIGFIWRAWGQGLMTFLAATFANILTVVRGALTIIQGIIKTVTSLIKGDWSGAWAGIKQIVSGAWTVIKGVVSQAMNIIKTVIAAAWSVIKAVTSAAMGYLKGQISASLNAWKALFSAAWSAIKSLVASQIAAVRSAVSSGMSAVTSAVSSAWSAVRSATSSAWASIKSAVSSGVSGAVSFIAGLPGRAVSALGSVGSLLYSAGADLVRGFLNGISSMVGEVASRAASMAASAVSAAKGALGIQSPSRAFIEIGQFVGKGLAIGLQGSAAQVAAASKTLVSGMAKVFTERVKTKDSTLIKALRGEVTRLGPLVKKHKASAKQLAAARRALDNALNHKGKASDIGFAAATAVMNGLKKQTDAAASIAKQRTAVAAKLKVAQDKLAAAVKLKADFAASVRAQAADLGNVVKNSSVTSAALGGQDIVANMKNRLAAMTKFAADVAKLKKLGLNNTAYKQIIDAGVDGGGADAAAGLLAGGKAVVGQVNSLQGKINGQGKKLGDTSSKVLYQAGVDSAKGLVKGLESQAAALAKASKKVADAIVKSIKKALGIKSPSRVLADQVGRFIPLGVVRGIDSERAALDKSMRSLVTVPKVSPGIAGGASVAGGLGGGSRMHPADIAALASAMSNVQIGLDGRNVSASVDQRLGQIR